MPYRPGASVWDIPAVPRPSAARRGYNRRWRWASKAFLDRYPYCGDRARGLPAVMSRCRELGLNTPASVVDHVDPHKGDQQKFWSEDNWQSACASCHSRKTKAGL
jgi:5-methylcytosine-specific restriction protein A